jgi:hypothetical protein
MYDSWHIHRIVVVYVDEVRQCLRTAATSGHIVHPPGDILAWRATVKLY